MRLNQTYLALLAVFACVFLQAASRAVPVPALAANTLLERIFIPKVPSRPASPVSPKPGGGSGGSVRPGGQVRPNGGTGTRPGVTACKRADGQGCSLDSYQTIDMNSGRGGTTLYGHVNWKPAEGEQAGPKLRYFTERLFRDIKREDEDVAPDGNTLLAALYVPNRGVFLSTTARDGAADDIVDTFRSDAPGLYRVTEGRRNAIRGAPNAVHVEDSVIYRYEQRYKTPEGRLPEGSMMAIFGQYEKNGTPQVVVPCKGRRQFVAVQRNPSCEKVVNNLGIGLVNDRGDVTPPRDTDM
ncbi:hypothetical protein BDW62DRAFT_204099 [Aspergillus aurantiobrunneus]